MYETAKRHFVVLLDIQTEKQLKELSNKRGLNEVQALRAVVGVGLSEVCQQCKTSLDYS